MKNNASLKELAGHLKAAESILIFIHTNTDGDALGAAAALCRALRNEGKTAWILIDEEIPHYIDFMDTEFCTADADCLISPDVCICVDCGEYGRFPAFADKYDEGRLRLCVDHHATGSGFGDYYYIDESAAATCQIVYRLLREMDVYMDVKIAESLYTGLSTDTGSFQFSNTTAETHLVAAELLRAGIDHTAINVRLYQTVPVKKIKLQTMILQRAEFLHDGKVAVSCVTGEMLQQASAILDDAEGSIDMLRNIEGVEMAVFLKEKGDCVKVSMRAKSYANVDKIAASFGGGGHKKAAGCTLHMDMNKALTALRKEIDDYWEKLA